MHCNCGFRPGRCFPLSYVQQSLTLLDSILLPPYQSEQTHGCTGPFFMPAEPTGKIHSQPTPVYPGSHWSFPVVSQTFLVVSQSFLTVNVTVNYRNRKRRSAATLCLPHQLVRIISSIPPTSFRDRFNTGTGLSWEASQQM